MGDKREWNPVLSMFSKPVILSIHTSVHHSIISMTVLNGPHCIALTPNTYNILHSFPTIYVDFKSHEGCRRIGCMDLHCMDCGHPDPRQEPTLKNERLKMYKTWPCHGTEALVLLCNELNLLSSWFDEHSVRTPHENLLNWTRVRLRMTNNIFSFKL